MSASATSSFRQPAPDSGIKVRRMDFTFDDDIEEFWFDGNPLLTCFLTALSVAFPAGERFFIDSVRHYQKDIQDPELAAQVRAFIGQEANHTKEHLAMNQLMARKGYPIEGMEAFVAKRIKILAGRSSPAMNLARTAAIEHFTAIFASAFVENGEVFKRMHPELAGIWAWHSVEEIEHRSVAFDVYKEQVGDEKLRLRAMRLTTALFVTVVFIRTLILLQRSGHLFDIKSWRHGMGLLWGRKGIFRSVIPRYRDYYRQDFHPSQHNNDSQVEKIKQVYLGDKA